MRLLIVATFLTTVGALAQAQEQEANVTLQSTVTGNQEQPRVMYIVPWQQPEAAEFDYELNNTIAEELFTPVDRDEFVRGLVYQHRLEHGQLAAADDAVKVKD